MNINKKIQNEILEASKLLDQRGESYGNAIVNHGDIKDFFNLILRNKLSEDLVETDVILQIITLKLARLMKSPTHLDSWQDIINYCGIAIVINKNNKYQDEIVRRTIEEFKGDYTEEA